MIPIASIITEPVGVAHYLIVGAVLFVCGALCMANAGPDTNGSQFFIICGMSGMQLPPSYSLFGKVVDGLDVVLELEKVGTPGAGVPKQKVYMESVTITES